MNTFKILIFAVAILLIAGTASAQILTPKEMLGKAIFFDANLSTPTGQSCASCHSPETGFTGPTSDVNATTVVYPGAIPTRFGNRKPPTAAYGGKSPIMYRASLKISFDENIYLHLKN
ncbi:MAG: cytochrome c peroxidase, partial [Bacteroidota bacterium]|nr:cytochrome c peroxidase [Bacteroidota bacterium]